MRRKHTDYVVATRLNNRINSTCENVKYSCAAAYAVIGFGRQLLCRLLASDQLESKLIHLREIHIHTLAHMANDKIDMLF